MEDSKLKAKQRIVVAIFAIDYLLFMVSGQPFYWWISDVCIMVETFLFMGYILCDISRFGSLAKSVFVSVVVLVSVNLLFSANIMFIKIRNRQYPAEHIERIISEQHSNYIAEYSIPFIIFMVLILPTLLWIKSRKNFNGFSR